MELTFVTEFGDVFTVEIDPNMELENVMALLEVESGIPASDQSISLDGRQLTEPKRTMLELGATGASVMLQLRRKVRVTNPAGQAIPQDAETIRLQILGDPSLMAQLRERRPDLAAAAVNDPARFADLLRQTHEAERAQEREIAMLNADPFNLEAQRRIEEIIREQAMLENMRHAMEYSPESFAVVTML
ncbi:hypothetical protein H0H93_013200 [Arthromyces matolae]|nr:hypothetical protein H0H93_013200 [Arthromyces matolae]